TELVEPRAVLTPPADTPTDQHGVGTPDLLPHVHPSVQLLHPRLHNLGPPFPVPLGWRAVVRDVYLRVSVRVPPAVPRDERVEVRRSVRMRLGRGTIQRRETASRRDGCCWD